MEQSFKLRSSLQPYVAITIIFLLVLCLGLFVGITKHDWGAFITMLIASCIFIPYFILFGMSYQISFDGNSITMKSAGYTKNPKRLTSIGVSEITGIAQETSDLHTTVKMGRPFRRIAIYDKPNQKFIDVSLKHFVIEDIKKLMRTLKEKRPDLEVPFSN